MCFKRVGGVTPPELAVKVGFNPCQSAERPEEYVVLRHVPVARDTFGDYGQDMLPNSDALPTWTYTTPHKAAKKTPQNESCSHGNAEFFLTADDVRPDELEANKDFIVIDIPEKVEEP